MAEQTKMAGRTVAGTRAGQTEPAAAPAELPAPGYPISEDAVSHWFREHHGRAPTDQELGAIIGAMAQREATPPRYAPEAVAKPWVFGPSPTRPGRG